MPLSDLFNNNNNNSLFQDNTQSSQNEDLQRALRQTENTKRRLEAAGQLDKAQKTEKFNLSNLLKWLAAPGYAANNLIREFTDRDAGATPNQFDPLKAFWRGLTLQEQVEGSEIIEDFGIKNKTAQGVLGFAFDVLNPLDLLNWVSFGVGKTVLKGGLKGTAALSHAFGDDVAEAIVKTLGKNADNLAAKTSGELSKKVIQAAKSVGANTDELAKLMAEGMIKKGGNLSSKIPYNASKRLTVGLETPFTNKALTKAVEIPGTEVITKPLGAAKDAFLATKAGDRLAKMFSTTYTPKEVSDSTVLRKIQESGNKLTDKVAEEVSDNIGKQITDTPEIVDNSMEIGPEINKAVKRAVEFTPEEGAKVYQEFKQGLQEIFETVPRKEEEFFKQVENIFRGTTQEDRQIVLDALVGKTTEIPKRLQPVVDGFKAWRESIVKTYKEYGIPIHELENYVPFIHTRGLRESERMGLKAIFGEKAKNIETYDDILEMISKLDPHLRQRSFNVVDPRDINRLLDSPWLSEDPAHMMMVRGARAIKAQEAAKFVDNFLTEYGLTPDDISKLKSMPKGYKLYENVVDSTGARVLKQVTNITEENSDKIVAIPEEFAKVFNEYSEILFNQDSKNALIKLFDNATSIWKKFAYLYNPGHIPRDLTGNMWQGYLMGIRNPSYYKHSADILKQIPEVMNKLDLKNIDTSDIDSIIRAYKQKVKQKIIKPLTVEINGKKIDAFEAFQKARKYGALETAAAMAETPQNIQQALNIAQGKKISQVVGKYENLMRKLTEDTNNWTRFAGYLHQLANGNSYTKAAANVKKFYFDYFDLTPFERKVMKRIIPFYTWTRKNIPMEIEALLRRPKDFARVQKAIDAIQTGENDLNELPDWAKDTGLFELGDTGVYINPNLPYQDLGRLPLNTDNVRNLLASLNPLIRGPIEMSTNMELYSGKPLEDYTGEQQDMPFIAPLLRLLGQENVPQVSKRYGGYMINQLPLLRNLDTILNPENPRQGARMATMVGLPSYFDEEQLKSSQIYEENRRLLEILRLLRDQGVDIPTTYELDDTNPLWELLGIDMNQYDADNIREKLTNIDIGLQSIFK